MDIKAITKAKSRLRVAEKAVAELEKCDDYQLFSDTWYTFLCATKNVYTVLEQGSKDSAQDRQWFGNVKNIRRNDELLQYLFEARNDDEHGLDCSTKHVPGRLAIGVARNGFSNAIRINGRIGAGGILNVESMDGKPVLIEETPPHVQLISVNARGDRIFLPPTSHRNIPLINTSPIVIAKLYLTYLTELVAEAEART